MQPSTGLQPDFRHWSLALVWCCCCRKGGGGRLTSTLNCSGVGPASGSEVQLYVAKK